RARLAAALLLRQPQPVQVEAGLGDGGELALEPGAVHRDRPVDVRLRGPRTDDELRRQALTDVQPVPAHPVRAAYVQLDQATADVHEAHGQTVGVVSDDNACAAHARLHSRA